jgi:RNA polymerase sigma-70 factor (ECF subfamily)
MSPPRPLDFNLILRDHLKPIYNFIYRLIGDAAAADDVAQETFIKAWRAADRYNPEYPLRAWLFTIARNTATDWLRRKKPLLFSQLGDDDEVFADSLVSPVADPETLAATADEAEELLRQLDGLPLATRTIVILHLVNEFSFAEIAAIVREPLNTVKSRYRRAISKWRQDQRQVC